jgi:hypothetical protein
MSEENEWVVRLKNVNDDNIISESEPLYSQGVSSKIRKILEEHEKADINNLMIEVLPDE